MKTAETFLRDFFTARDLPGPDGRPLYRYRIRDAEFAEVELILSEELAERDFHQRAIGPKGAMAFCLWASEWWRCNYRSGAWKWQPLVEALGHPEFAPGDYRYGELRVLVTRGLRAWGRTVHRAGYNRNYLGTLVCEGGLPQHLILREKTHLRHYLEDLLDEFQLFGAAGVPPRDLAERVRNRLPRAWHRNVVYELCGELIQEICRLQREVGDTKTPVLDLDRMRPGWRDELPVRVTDQVARELLNGLLVGAIRGAKRARIGVRWKVDLVPVGTGDWVLRGSFDLPKKIREDAVHRLFPDWAQSNAASRFTLGTQRAGRPFRALAVAKRRQTGEDGSAYRLELFPAAEDSHTREVVAARKLVARIPDHEYSTDLFRGASGLGELPWVFVPDDEESAVRSACRFAGQGSVRLKQAWCLVAADRNVDVERVKGEAKQEGSLGNEGQRAVYWVSGRARFRAEDGTQITVETEADFDSSGIEYHLVGSPKSFDNGVTVFFEGGPQVHEMRDGDPVERVLEDYLEWKPNTPDGVWQPYSPSAVESGEVRGWGRLRYIKDDEVYYSVATGMLPRGADITIHPSHDPSQGEIRFTGFGNIVAGVADGAGLEARGRENPEEYLLALRATSGEVPREVSVVLDWYGRGRMDVILPFPAKRAAFLDPGGFPLPENARITEGSIAGIQAEVIVPGSARYQITGEFSSDQNSDSTPHGNGFVREIPEVNHGHYVLELAQLDLEIAERLELTDSPRAAVRLAIVDADTGEPLPAARISVTRFDLEFEPLADEPIVRLDSRSQQQISASDLEDLSVAMLSLLEPDEEPVCLVRSARAEWGIPVDSLAPGPYLVLGRLGARQRVRPMAWYAGEPAQGRNPDSAEATNVAQAYARAAVTDYRSTHDSFGSIVRRMASDPGHGDWDLVFGYLRQESLPVMAFPLLRALFRNPVACVMAAADASESDFELLWERMELFPFAWWQIPLTSWKKAYKSYAAYWQGQLDEMGDTDQAWEILARQTDASIDRVTSHLVGLKAAFGFLRDRVACRPISDDASKIVNPEHLRTLRRRYFEHRLACPANTMPERAVTDLPGMSAEVQRIVADHRWCGALFRHGGTEMVDDNRVAVADSPALTAALVVAGDAASEELARAIRQVRANHRSWFDEALRLAQLFCFGRKQSEQIHRQLNKTS